MSMTNMKSSFLSASATFLGFRVADSGLLQLALSTRMGYGFSLRMLMSAL